MQRTEENLANHLNVLANCLNAVKNIIFYELYIYLFIFFFTAKKCKKPLQFRRCVNRCRMTCNDLRDSKRCKSGGCKAACACPLGKFAQDKKCVKISKCRCLWNKEKLGPRPAGVSREVPKGYVYRPNKCRKWLKKSYKLYFNHYSQTLNYFSRCHNGRFTCTKVDCRPRNCKWSAWSSWSKCNVKCGRGKKIATRKVRLPAKNGGRKCWGPSRKHKKCSKKCCIINGKIWKVGFTMPKIDMGLNC